MVKQKITDLHEGQSAGGSSDESVRLDDPSSYGVVFDEDHFRTGEEEPLELDSGDVTAEIVDGSRERVQNEGQKLDAPVAERPTGLTGIFRRPSRTSVQTAVAVDDSGDSRAYGEIDLGDGDQDIAKAGAPNDPEAISEMVQDSAVVVLKGDNCDAKDLLTAGKLFDQEGKVKLENMPQQVAFDMLTDGMTRSVLAVCDQARGCLIIEGEMYGFSDLKVLYDQRIITYEVLNSLSFFLWARTSKPEVVREFLEELLRNSELPAESMSLRLTLSGRPVKSVMDRVCDRLSRFFELYNHFDLQENRRTNVAMISPFDDEREKLAKTKNSLVYVSRNENGGPYCRDLVGTMERTDGYYNIMCALEGSDDTPGISQFMGDLARRMARGELDPYVLHQRLGLGDCISQWGIPVDLRVPPISSMTASVVPTTLDPNNSMRNLAILGVVGDSWVVHLDRNMRVVQVCGGHKNGVSQFLDKYDRLKAGAEDVHVNTLLIEHTGLSEQARSPQAKLGFKGVQSSGGGFGGSRAMVQPGDFVITIPALDHGFEERQAPRIEDLDNLVREFSVLPTMRSVQRGPIGGVAGKFYGFGLGKLVARLQAAHDRHGLNDPQSVFEAMELKNPDNFAGGDQFAGIVQVR